MAKKSKPAKRKAVKKVAKKAPARKVARKVAKVQPMGKESVEAMLKKAYEPARLAMIYHPFYEGKIEVVPKCAVWAG